MVGMLLRNMRLKTALKRLSFGTIMRAVSSLLQKVEQNVRDFIYSQIQVLILYVKWIGMVKSCMVWYGEPNYGLRLNRS